MSNKNSSANLSAFTDVLLADGASSIIQYGSSISSSSPADIDLVAIYPGRAERSNLEIGPFDVIRLSQTAWDQYRRVLDPVYVTEPLLTGEFILSRGQSDPDQLRSELRNTDPDAAVTRHALTESLTHYTQARTHARNSRYQTAVASLSFAESYLYYMQWYAAGHAPIPYDNLRQELARSDGQVILEGIDLRNGDFDHSEVVTILDQFADELVTWLTGT